MDKRIVRGWTDSEDNILREYYPLGGGKLCVEKGLNKKLSTIRMRAMKLGIHSKNTVWSDAELSVLYDMHKDNTVNAMSKRLKGRSPKAIKNKLEELGLECVVKWTEDEIALVKEYYPKGGSKLVKQKGLDKPTNLISSKASSLGLRLDVPRANWSDADVEVLVKYYGKEGMDVLDRLPGKTKLSVINKLNTINTYYREKYSHWSKEDKCLLIENKDKPIEELVTLLKQRSKEDIEDLVSYYRWKYIKNSIYTRWSEEEVKFLIDNYGLHSVQKLQEMGLNKSKSSIYNKVLCLGLSRCSMHRVWSKEELTILEENYPYKSLNDLCKLLPSKSSNSIRCKANIIGLRKDCPLKWSDAEIDILITYYTTYGAERVLKELEKQLGIVNRTKPSVYKKAIKLGLQHK